ncbi:hypothetical protein K474DRAFT_1656953 [Panus rudis PR-1116 ss-1]|nr:hypothetical protein K474DRAFT_1656953 [Panus rudis PR-1116 ss-1]
MSRTPQSALLFHARLCTWDIEGRKEKEEKRGWGSDGIGQGSSSRIRVDRRQNDLSSPRVDRLDAWNAVDGGRDFLGDDLVLPLTVGLEVLFIWWLFYRTISM